MVAAAETRRRAAAANQICEGRAGAAVTTDEQWRRQDGSGCNEQRGRVTAADGAAADGAAAEA